MDHELNQLRPIRGFSDPSINGFSEWEKSIGVMEVEDPYPRLAELREIGAIHRGDIRELFGLASAPAWRGRQTFTVMGYNEALEVLEKPEVFSNSIIAELNATGFGPENLHSMDPPKHTIYRRIFQKAFLPKYISQWRETLLPGIVNHFIDGFIDVGRAELIEDFCKQFPFHFIFGLLDLPRQHQRTFHELAISLIASQNPAIMAEASRNLGDYLEDLLMMRRAKPGRDLISVLSHVEIDGVGIPDQVIISFLRQLLTAGGGTTFHATGTMLVGLLGDRKRQWDMVLRNRKLVDKAVQEALRWDSPSMTVIRAAMRDTTVGGVAIPAGSCVVLLVSAINRKPFAGLPANDRFDVHNSGLLEGQLNLAFSYGPHICIGRHLAQMEMAIALNALLNRVPSLRADPQHAPPTVRGLITRTPTQLHVVFGDSEK